MTTYKEALEERKAIFNTVFPPLKSHQEWMREWEFMRHMDNKQDSLTATELMLAEQSYNALLGKREEMKKLIAATFNAGYLKAVEMMEGNTKVRMARLNNSLDLTRCYIPPIEPVAIGQFQNCEDTLAVCASLKAEAGE